jgi:hypothetical protein
LDRGKGRDAGLPDEKLENFPPAEAAAATAATAEIVGYADWPHPCPVRLIGCQLPIPPFACLDRVADRSTILPQYTDHDDRNIGLLSSKYRLSGCETRHSLQASG